MSYSKYIVEALSINEKRKKKKHDSQLPWTGLNWGEDKGKGIATFNHLNGTEFSGTTAEAGGCFEDMDLDEDRTKSITEDDLIARTFGARVLPLLIDAQENGGIQNISNIQEFITNSLRGKPVAAPIGKPSTRSLLRTSNPRGAGSKEAELRNGVVHHVFGVTGDGLLDDIPVIISLQNNTRIHNGTVSRLKDKIKSEVSDIFETFKKLSSKVVHRLNQAETEEELTRYQNLKDYLEAWAVREIFKKVTTDKDYRAIYQELLSQELGKYVISHLESILSKNDKLITIKTDKGDYKVKLILRTIGKDQRDTLHRFMAGPVLKDFPLILDDDFLLCKIEQGPDNVDKVFNDIDEFRDFFKLSGSLGESLNEDNEEYKLINSAELRKYVEENLLAQPLENTYYNGTTKKSPYYQEIVNVIMNLDGKKSNETSLVAKINKNGERDPQTWGLKQKAVAEVVRELFNNHNFKVKYKGKAQLDPSTMLWKFVASDILLDMGGTQYKISGMNPGVLINAESLFHYIDNKQIIETDIKDPHFLDSAGEIVPGVKCKYDTDGSLMSFVVDPTCEVDRIYTVIFDTPYKNGNYLSTLQKFKNLHTLVIDEKNCKVLRDSTWYTDRTVGQFQGLYSVKEVKWLNPQSTTIGGGCFRSIGFDTFEIPECVYRLGSEAFAYSSLKKLFIPKTVHYLGDSCFTGCDDLVITFELPKDELPEVSRWGSIYRGNKDYTGYTVKWGKSSVKKVVWGGSKPEEPKDETLSEQLLTEDIAAVRDMFKDIPDEKFNEIVKLDPTYVEGRNSVGKYTKWLLNLYKKGLVKDEDLYKVPDLLSEFEQKRRWMQNKDIQQFRNLGDLSKALSEVEVGELSKNAQQKAEHRKLRGMDLDDLNAEKVYEDSDWLVYIPKDFEASRKLSSLSNSEKGNNRWCTGISANSDYHFNSYTSEGPLYININKNNPEEESYQFHFESSQFMDKNDRQIELIPFLKKNRGLYNFYTGIGKFKALKQADEKYHILDGGDATIDSQVDMKRFENRDEVTKILFKALRDGDFETLLDFYGLDLESLDKFKAQIKRIGIDDELKQLLASKGLTEEDYWKALEFDNSDLSTIIFESILTAIKKNIIDQIKAWFKKSVMDAEPAVKEFDFDTGKLKLSLAAVIERVMGRSLSRDFEEDDIKQRAKEITDNLPHNVRHILQHGNEPWRPDIDRLNKAKYLKELKDSLRYL